MNQTCNSILILGGGSAGWLTAAYLARRLGSGRPDGPTITLVESPNVPSVGVGEGTLPSLRLTLATLGVDEAAFMRASEATFKQGIHFSGWSQSPDGSPASYFHPFNSPRQMGGIDLVPYWSLGAAGKGDSYTRAITPQHDVYTAMKAPKRLEDAPFSGPLNYAYHLDVHRFGEFLKAYALGLGVKHVSDHITAVERAETGDIAGLDGEASGRLTADLYVDCSGFKARLIGDALGEPLVPVGDSLFCDRAVAIQVPWDRPDAPLPSATISTAHEAGWTWDIGLRQRRGVGYVWSSAHSDADAAETILRRYVGQDADDHPVRHLTMTTGFRRRQWVGNCVAVGLSAGFLEPLESTGILLIEAAAHLIADNLPRRGDFAPAARHFNSAMGQRFTCAVDFLKLHYALSNRRDTAFWRDNADPASWPLSLRDKLDRWQVRLPNAHDLDSAHDSFRHINYAYVLIGMGAAPDLAGDRARYPFLSEATAEFGRIKDATGRAMAALPDHRALVEGLQTHRFGAAAPRTASMGGAR
ncbi:tryptophan halogenase [Maricaulis sp. W15]|uniref:tryptophan halogenase family protein n=1 Tax=Maricaulis sp. W15 TaxID=1772333 RepID=UPI000948DF4F|nr:tryptophan halogenase family protein [Maricaulis sp. W15]OLF74143.1 tryptophan halogenase [Maricaulis sp. W15]